MTSNPTERPAGDDRTQRQVRNADSVAHEPVTDEIPYALRLEKLASRVPHARRYEIEGEIARGGMGTVLKIWDEDIRRHVARKVALSDGDGTEGGSARFSPDLLQRFLDEAQISGQLDHPGVVPVY